MGRDNLDTRPRRAASILTTLRAAERACLETIDQLSAALAVQNASSMALQTAIQQHENTPSKALPACDVPPSEHRRQHRAGRPARLDSDAELRVFVLARIERLTYAEIAADVARHFPKARHVGRSAIHHWWNKKGVRERYTE